MKTNVLAHRGFSGRFPENSLRSFREAIAVGADGVELDVQRTRDGELVVIHDERLDYSTTLQGWIQDLTWAEIRTAKLRCRSAGTVYEDAVPHLEEVLALLADHNMLVNIELKNGLLPYAGIEEQVIELVDRLNLRAKTIISSFNHASILRLKQIDSSITAGIIFAGCLFDQWNYARSVRADALHPDRGFVDGAFVRAAHDNGFQVNTYTVNDELEMRRLIDAGVNGIITNFPDKLLKVMNNV